MTVPAQQHVQQVNANGIVNKTDCTSSMGNIQGQSGGDTEVKALIEIQEPLHSELHHST